MLELPCASLFESFGDECHLGVKPFVYLESLSSVNAVTQNEGSAWDEDEVLQGA